LILGRLEASNGRCDTKRADMHKAFVRTTSALCSFGGIRAIARKLADIEFGYALMSPRHYFGRI